MIVENYRTKPDEILFLPLGGSGEIGGNLNLYAAAGKWLAVDCGVSFGDAAPGIDVVMPDPAFIAERTHNLVGLVITHGHEDHIGAIEYLWQDLQCPIYATPFTAALIRAKMSGPDGKTKIRIIEKQPGERWTLGPFTLELVHVTHSIPEAAMLVIETTAGRLLHTGDWKFDPEPLTGPPSDLARLRQLGDEGVLAVIGDSTNATVAGRSGSEASVRKGLIEVVKPLRGRVVIACFASNVARLLIAAEAAKQSGRELAFVGRSLWRVLGAAQESGVWKNSEPLSPEDAGYLPADRALYVVTGSQGEARSALARLAQNEHPELVLEKGDTVIFSSREIPGNEKEIARVQNQLIQHGVHVMTADDAPNGATIHVSGHPAHDELTELYQMVRPQILVPVHGEPVHQQAHIAIAEACQISQHLVPDNGDVLRISAAGVEKIGAVPVGRLGVDGKRLVKLQSVALKDRQKIGMVGAVVVGLAVDVDGELAADATVTLLGVNDDMTNSQLEDNLLDRIEDDFDNMPRADRLDDEIVAATVKLAVRRHIKQVLGTKPVIKIQIARV